MLNAYQGIYVYDPGNDILGMMATSEDATEALNGITSLSAAVDPDGSLWFASFGGVVRFEPQSESIKRYVDKALEKTGYQATPSSLKIQVSSS